MAQLRIALAQMNSTVGDLAGNAESIRRYAAEARQAGAHLLAVPEMALTGYPVEDLALRGSFVQASRAALADLARALDAAGCGDLPVVVGYLDHGSAPAEPGPPKAAVSAPPKSRPQDAAAVLFRGGVLISSAKHHLPNYGVFDEYRYFASGNVLPVVRVRGVDVAIAICEDLWQDGGPVAACAEAGAGLLLSINASPYELNKDDVRYALLQCRAREAGCALAYVNMVGGQDELVFDGDSMVVDADGGLLARAGQFTEELVLVDLDLPAAAGAAEPGSVTDQPASNGMTIRRVPATVEAAEPYPAVPGVITPRVDDRAEVYAALVTGLRDYVRKNGFRTVVFGLSGGIDSALTAVISCDAIGPDNVYGVSLPSRYSSEHSKDDAAQLARNTGMHYEVLPIGNMVEAYLKTLADLGAPLTGVADENLQARVRGTALMALSNQRGHLVLAPGNKSELAVGYSTIYDAGSIGGYAPIKDVAKTLVWELARWRNAHALELGLTPPIPVNSIEKPPSAELRPDQKDSDSLPDYELLDQILDLYVEGDQGMAAIIERGFDPALVRRILGLIDRAEYKRRQFPPGTKISVKAFGRDRRLPITNRWQEG
ncbi:MAG TPA: NAD+ synthase [Actinocrinis sp.]|nr:NAD+ synthase [Actinocrinis sp.]